MRSRSGVGPLKGYAETEMFAHLEPGQDSCLKLFENRVCWGISFAGNERYRPTNTGVQPRNRPTPAKKYSCTAVHGEWVRRKIQREVHSQIFRIHLFYHGL